MGRTYRKIPGPRRNHMKLNLFTLAVAALIASGPAFAQQSQTQPNQPASTVGQREQNQQDRVADGIDSGQMTAGETKNVESRESNLNREVRDDRQADDGHLTQQERQQINHQQNNLSHSIYQDKLRNVGLFLAQLQVREKNLSALMTPRMGDSMVKRDGTAWLSEVSKEPAQLDVDNLGQIAALPLGSHLRIDAWDDKVHFLNVKGEPILNAREKMPLELTPIYFRLSRYGSGAHAGLSPAENLSPTADERAPYPPRQ